ncbi:MAG: hypothetical protein KIT72_10760 [Polyangiaceae bacterium]|nr:hypothetical protein [Polyangiaceae bacterium]MCW5790893.1 hypothetical protein [Polyangiaceae bacterium]
MRVCSGCGSVNHGTERCVVCGAALGAPLDPAPAVEPQQPDGGSLPTRLQYSPGPVAPEAARAPAPEPAPAPAPPEPATAPAAAAPAPAAVPAAAPAPAAAPPVNPKQTLLGIAPVIPGAPAAPVPPAAAPSAPSAPPAPPENPKQTLLGIAPVIPGAAAGAAPPSAANPKQTLLGIAPTSPAALHAAAQQPPSPSAALPQAAEGAPQAGAAAEPAPAAPGPLHLPSKNQTRLGVAMPGIAPTHSAPGGAPVPTEAPVAAPQLTSPRRRPLWPWLLVGTLGLLGVLMGVGYWLLRPSTPVSAQLVSSPDGEALALSCLECPDGSRVERGAASAVFTAHQATLPLSEQLGVGDHELTISLSRGGRTETLKLPIGVDYRAHIDLGALKDRDPPALALVVEARPGSTVEVQGQPLSLDTNGRGVWREDLSLQLTGPSSRVERLERDVEYQITPPGGAPQRGSAKLRIGIATLGVDAPLPRLTTAKPSFMLSGVADPRADVTVTGQPIKRGDAGRFAQAMAISSPGETTIRVKATLADHAPRFIPLTIHRMDSLAAAAESFRKQPTKRLAEVRAALGESRGVKVAWTGRVSDASSAHGRQVLLLDVAGCGAASCLTRVVYAGEATPQVGDRITVFGEVQGGVPGPRTGQLVPEVYAEFLLSE